MTKKLYDNLEEVMKNIEKYVLNEKMQHGDTYLIATGLGQMLHYEREKDIKVFRFLHDKFEETFKLLD
jgi:hypothetical protein